MRTPEGLDVYNLSQDFSDQIWFMVGNWDNFARAGMGKQITNAAGSISSNIAEGYRRFSIKENINFCFYSRGSILETKNWLQKCVRRGLINEEDHKQLISSLETIHRKLNGYIKVLRANISRQKSTS